MPDSFGPRVYLVGQLLPEFLRERMDMGYTSTEDRINDAISDAINTADKVIGLMSAEDAAR